LYKRQNSNENNVNGLFKDENSIKETQFEVLNSHSSNNLHANEQKLFFKRDPKVSFAKFNNNKINLLIFSSFRI
jgi:hypothetical protein